MFEGARRCEDLRRFLLERDGCSVAGPRGSTIERGQDCRVVERNRSSEDSRQQEIDSTTTMKISPIENIMNLEVSRRLENEIDPREQHR